MLTWSFGCTGAYEPRAVPSSSFARFASTSFAFMLCDVPAPAWYGSTTKCSRCCAGEHLVRGAHDGVGEPRLEPPRLLVRERRRLLDPDDGGHEHRQRPQPADREVLHGAHRLHAVQRAGGDRQRPERILLEARRLGHGSVVFSVSNSEIDRAAAYRSTPVLYVVIQRNAVHLLVRRRRVLPPRRPSSGSPRSRRHR